MLTDDLFSLLEEQTSEFGCIPCCWTDDILAELRRLRSENERLRELETACNTLWRKHYDGRRYLAWQGAMSTEEQDAQAAIGRLLEEGR